MRDKIVTLLILLVIGSAMLAKVSEAGPLIWIKRAARRGRALEGTDRRELVARVQQLLPQANDSNVVFSLHRESSASGGSQFTILSSTYYPMVFVVDRDALWMIPMAYDRHKRSYAPGTPERFSADDVRQMRLTGKRGKTLTFTFLLELDGRKREIDMDLTLYCLRKNRFYPFDLMQETACHRALQAAKTMALTACHLTPEDLEAGRLKDRKPPECFRLHRLVGNCGGPILARKDKAKTLITVQLPEDNFLLTLLLTPGYLSVYRYRGIQAGSYALSCLHVLQGMITADYALLMKR